MFDRCDKCGKRVLFPAYRSANGTYCSETCQSFARFSQQGHAIVSCPSCGTRNRLFAYSESLRPLCGKCKSPLPARSDISAKVPSKILHSIGDRRGLLMVSMVVCILIGLVSLQYWGKGKGSEQGTALAVNTLPKPAKKVSNQPLQVQQPLPDRRLPSGTLIKSSLLNGNCQLVIENGLDTDAAVKLLRSGSNQCLAYFYVSSRATDSVKGIPDGSYRLLFVAGRDWDDKKQCFIRDKAFSEFDRQLSFETISERRSDAIHYEYRGHRVTLHKIRHGNASAHGVSEALFLGN